MRVVYWARFALAKARLTELLGGVAGCELVVVDTLEQTLAALPGAEALVLFDAPVGEARQIVQALAAPGKTVRWMHFILRPAAQAARPPACRPASSSAMPPAPWPRRWPSTPWP